MTITPDFSRHVEKVIFCFLSIPIFSLVILISLNKNAKVEW